MTDRETPVVTDEIEVPTDSTQADDAAMTPDVPVVVVPDRADAPVSEITERFLRAIVAQIPLDRIEELHLFSPLRQGGVETGIAVVAARVPIAAPEQPLAPELPLEAVETAEAPELVDDADVVTESIIEHDEIVQDEIVHDEIERDEVVAVASDEAADDEALVNELSDDESLDDASDEHLNPYADEAADDEDLHDDIVAESVAPPAPIERHTVYTARYRLVQKGPERGKWEADVKAEADAPLVTVETVVRGVQRRAGEESEILRYSARQIAKALRE